MKTGSVPLRAAAAAAAVLICACSARPRPAEPPPAPADPLEAVVSAILNKAGDIPDGTLAVHDITGISGETMPEGRLVAERLTSRLAASGEVRVIERRRLEAALKELSLSASGTVDEAGIARAGFLSGAGAVVTGTLARLNGGYELNARVVNVVTGDVIAAAAALLQIDLAPGGGTVRRLPAPRPSQPAAAPGSAEAPPGWKIWPGRGNSSFRDGTIAYCLERRQIDHSDELPEGYYPGLLLEREISGDKWTVELSAEYGMKVSGGHWLSSFVWLGEKDVRPLRGSSRSALSLTAFRFLDQGYGSDYLGLLYDPGGKISELSPAVNSVRFERDGNLFTVYGGVDGKNYIKGITIFSPAAGKAPSQRIVLGGQAFGDPGSCAVYRSITLNGKPLF